MTHLPLLALVFLLVSTLFSMIGIGGGIIKLPIMVLLCGVPMGIAVATSTVMVAVTALAGLVGHAARGAVPWHVALVLQMGR